MSQPAGDANAVYQAPVVELNSADAGEIRKAIHSIWLQVAKQTQDSDEGVLRAQSLTFVAIATGPDEFDEVDQVIREVAKTHPCRGILFIPEHSDSGELPRTTITMNCVGNGTRHTCSEKIAVHTGMNQMQDMHQVAAALFVEDMPRYVWWTSTRWTQTHLFERMADMADRMIVDTKRLEAPVETLPKFFEIASNTQNTAISDLNWGRITQWRELTVQVFNTPSLLKNVHRISRVEITVARSGKIHPPISALLFAAWLADRLGWELLGREAHKDHLQENTVAGIALRRPDGQVISIWIYDTERPDFERRIVSTRIFTDPPAQMEITIERSADMNTAQLEVKTYDCDPSRKSLKLEPVPLLDLIIREISYARRDAGYESALKIASAMWKHLQP
jgi:glucose-6-phosphate dehydrogenase assembly protein OpcA